MLQNIRDMLVDPRIRGLNPDSDSRLVVQNEILATKPLMKTVFEEFYQECIQAMEKNFCEDGIKIEIGAGLSFFKRIMPDLITTDIVHAPNLDQVLDAQNMEQIADSSVRAIFGLNCFHHLPEPRKFFSELLRVLRPKGGCVLIEPFYGTIARPFYKNLHSTEYFDPSQVQWETSSEQGVMTNANQALSFIVFVRDRAIFEREFPELEIVEVRPLHNYLRYLISGGLNFRQLLPDLAAGPIKALETLLKPISYHTALHSLIVIRKRA